MVPLLPTMLENSYRSRSSSRSWVFSSTSRCRSPSTRWWIRTACEISAAVMRRTLIIRSLSRSGMNGISTARVPALDPSMRIGTHRKLISSFVVPLVAGDGAVEKPRLLADTGHDGRRAPLRHAAGDPLTHAIAHPPRGARVAEGGLDHEEPACLLDQRDGPAPGATAALEHLEHAVEARSRG